MNNTIISIIVPYYNRAKYLKECISSILNQTYPFFELLLINDGSDDDSKAIAYSFKDFRIKQHSQEHSGCWVSKNYGIRKAIGEYVMFIDSDDMISPDYLKIAITTASNNPQFDYYYETAIDIIQEDSTPTNTIWRYLDYKREDRYRLINLFFDHQIGGIPHAGALIKKDLFQRFGYYDEIVNLSDTVYIIKNALNIRFFMIESLRHYYNRQHDLQTNKNIEAKNKAFADLLFYIFQKYPPALISSELINQPQSYVNQAYFDKFIQCSEKNEAGKDYYLNYASYYLKKIRENE